MKNIRLSFICNFLNSGNWCSPIFSHLFAYLVMVVGIPQLLHGLHHDHSLTFALIVSFSLGSLILLAHVYQYSIWIILTICMAVAGSAAWLWPQEQLGNWNFQIALHLLIWSLIAFMICAAAESIAALKAYCLKPD